MVRETPPKPFVLDEDAILAASENAVVEYHDPSPRAMVRIALAPCSVSYVRLGLPVAGSEDGDAAGPLPYQSAQGTG